MKACQKQKICSFLLKINVFLRIIVSRNIEVDLAQILQNETVGFFFHSVIVDCTIQSNDETSGYTGGGLGEISPPKNLQLFVKI